MILDVRMPGFSGLELQLTTGFLRSFHSYHLHYSSWR